MKDGYSFHSSENDLASFYEKVGNAYENIFKSCGLQIVGVEADSGAIGGASSKEFMSLLMLGKIPFCSLKVVLMLQILKKLFLYPLNLFH